MDYNKFKEFLNNNPTAYAGFRAVKVSNKEREKTVAEGDEVPFIFSVFFAPLIFSYILWKRSTYLITYVLFSDDSRLLSEPDHIFVMTSDSKYRTYTFEEAGKRLLEQDRDVLFVCSPSAAGQMDEWRQEGFRTESFTELLRFVSIVDLLVHIGRSASELYKLGPFVSNEYENYSTTYAFNYIVLEHIKLLSIQDLASDDPSIHSYSLMPYQIMSTVPERLYVYQHGVQRKGDEKVWSATRFFPANILIWGEAWLGNYEDFLHPEAKIHVVGSPWHDYLSKSKEEDSASTKWDVVFIGGSQSTTHSERKEEMYENLVAELVEACEKNDWTLAFKLHPVGSSTWYRERGWENYVVEFDGINEALKSAEIAVTYFSSAFVESIVLGTPIILDEAWSSGLSDVRPISGAHFIDNDNLEETMRELLNSEGEHRNIVEENRLVDIGQSIDNVLKVITSEDPTGYSRDIEMQA